MSDLHVHVKEWANRNVVQVRVYLGEDEDSARSVGTLVMNIDIWMRLSRCLQVALGKDFTRGECQHGCGHPSHLNDTCDVGIFTREGLPAVCACVDERRL